MPTLPTPSRRTARTLLAAGALVTALALTACDPEGADTGADAATPTTATAVTNSTATAAAPSGSSAAADRRTLVHAARAGGLPAVTGAGALSDVPIDPGEMRDGMHLVAGTYRAAATGRPVLFLGVDAVPEDPGKRREHLWRGLIDYALQNGSTGDPTTAEPYPTGPLGGSVECLSLPKAPTTDVICGWTDASTAAVALFPRTTPAEAARQFTAMRADLEH
ncbi:hypothetical protein [Kitasatospora sp. NPDC088346]|uniref:hypothetical protein n=1 Tax=Kitasatospora sp. NPDC088346 TaxID=3364073 RepID=UPI00382BE68E